MQILFWGGFRLGTVGGVGDGGGSGGATVEGDVATCGGSDEVEASKVMWGVLCRVPLSQD